MIFGERIAQADELYRLLHRQYPQRVGKIHSQMGTLANKNTLNASAQEISVSSFPARLWMKV